MWFLFWIIFRRACLRFLIFYSVVLCIIDSSLCNCMYNKVFSNRPMDFIIRVIVDNGYFNKNILYFQIQEDFRLAKTPPKAFNFPPKVSTPYHPQQCSTFYYMTVPYYCSPSRFPSGWLTLVLLFSSSVMPESSFLLLLITTADFQVFCIL